MILSHEFKLLFAVCPQLFVSWEYGINNVWWWFIWVALMTSSKWHSGGTQLSYIPFKCTHGWSLGWRLEQCRVETWEGALVEGLPLDWTLQSQNLWCFEICTEFVSWSGISHLASPLNVGTEKLLNIPLQYILDIFFFITGSALLSAAGSSASSFSTAWKTDSTQVLTA